MHGFFPKPRKGLRSPPVRSLAGAVPADLSKATATAQAWVGQVVRPGDRVVDATVGNGHDTLFLAGLVGPAGEVTGFDVQEQALARTRERLEAAGTGARVTLLAAGHETMAAHVAPGVAAVMFNLGWLPGGDHAHTTTLAMTLQALHAAWQLLRAGGLLTVVAYPGHPGGSDELAAAEAWAATLDPALARVRVARVHNTRRPAPVLLAAQHLTL